MATNQRTRAATESLSFLAISAGILILLNVLGTFAFGRLDCTANELFSLSDGSRRLAGDLTDELEITAYFTEDLPPPFHTTERYVRDILSEYVSASGGRIRVTFVNPDTEDEKEAAEAAGIQKVSHQAIKDDSVSVVEGYRGIVLRYLERTEVIPVIQDTSGLEYAITMKLKKLVGDKQTVGVIGGHEGPSLTEGLARLSRCMPMYELQEVQADSEIDPELAAVLVVEPQTELTEAELRNIDSYVIGGGSLGVFGGSMKVDVSGAQPSATPVDSGLNQLLRSWGATVEDGIVHDAQCSRAPLRTQLGMIPVPHPPVPIVDFEDPSPGEEEHPVSFRLSSSPLPFTSPIELVGDDEQVRTTVLARSSDTSWLVTAPSVSLQPRDPRSWSQSGDSGPFPLAVAIEGKLPSAFAGAENMSAESSSDTPARAAEDVHVLVVGGSFFLRDEALPQADQGGECQMSSNLALALNAMDWLAQDSDLIAVRAKTVEEPVIEVPLDVRQAEDDARTATTEAIAAAQEGNEEGVESAVQERDAAMERRKAAMDQWESTKGLYRWGNMVGIPFLLGLFGLIRWQLRRSKRQNIKL